MRGQIKNYEQEILTALGNGSMDSGQLRLQIKGSEQKYFLTLKKLLEEKKITKIHRGNSKFDYCLFNEAHIKIGTVVGYTADKVLISVAL